MSVDRLAALSACGVLDRAPEPSFAYLTQLAARLCGASAALVGFVDGEHTSVAASAGPAAVHDDLAAAFCARVVDRGRLLVIPDLRADPLANADPTAGFCAGTPLILADGVAVGALCIFGDQPRAAGLDDRERADLLGLAAQLVHQLDLRRDQRLGSNAAHDRAESDHQSALLRIGDLLRDLTEPDAMILQTARIAGEVLGAARAGYGIVEGDTRLVDIQPGWSAAGIAPLAGRFRFDDFGDIRRELADGEPLVIDDVRTDPRTAANPAPMQALSIGSLVNMPVRRRGHTVAVFLVQDVAARRWSAGDLAFIRNVADRLEVALGRLSAERQQHIRNQEVGHRLKNTLAMVQAIATQTLRTQVDRSVLAAFEQRLQALGSAHEALLARAWDVADMRTLVAGALSTFAADSRISLKGPAIALGARASLQISLIVHELATNAVKYGALSVPDARVAVRWRVEDADRLVFEWRESGGPPAHPPTRTGFGSRLLNLGLIGDGGSELHYDDAGFRAVMRAPLEEAIYRE